MKCRLLQEHRHDAEHREEVQHRCSEQRAHAVVDQHVHDQFGEHRDDAEQDTHGEREQHRAAPPRFRIATTTQAVTAAVQITATSADSGSDAS